MGYNLINKHKHYLLWAVLGFSKGGYCIKKMTRSVKARLTSGGFRETMFVYFLNSWLLVTGKPPSIRPCFMGGLRFDQ